MHIAFQIVKNNYICTFGHFFLSLCCSKQSLKHSFICTTLLTKFLKYFRVVISALRAKSLHRVKDPTGGDGLYAAALQRLCEAADSQ